MKNSRNDGSDTCSAAMRNTREYMLAGVCFASGVAIGTMAMYMLDPDRGRSRRAKLRASAISKVEDARELVRDSVDDCVTRARGTVEAAAEMLAGGRSKAHELTARMRSGS